MMSCAGYYDYETPLPNDIPGLDNFEGTVVHPQFWPENLDYQDKDVAIIGSGATAITLLPTIAKKASHATMVQRSPTYVLSMRQREPPINKWAKAWLPMTWALAFIHWKSFFLPWLFYKFCQNYPKIARGLIQAGVKQQLPEDYPVAENFTPKYNPWEQRMCMAPDGDFYRSLKEGKASIVTDTIQNVSEKSIVLTSGKILHPEIIITATGLKMQFAGGAPMSVDGQLVDMHSKHFWKGMMVEDIPNASVSLGYGNASWTLGADITARIAVRMLNYLKKKKLGVATPTLEPGSGMIDQEIMRLNSTYYQRGKHNMPKAGDQAPWQRRQMYALDSLAVRWGSINKGMKYTPAV